MSVAGDFKVIDINDAGTSSNFGGDDLDKINRILNGENLDLDILIDNEWSSKHNKLVIRDFTGDHKIRIGTPQKQQIGVLLFLLWEEIELQYLKI